MKTLSILLVDHDPYVRRSIELLLQRAGHRVTCSGAVSDALGLIRNHSFDVVVTDMLLGESDGIEVVRAASARRPSPRIVAMSGGGQKLRASYCVGLAVAFGAAVPLLKPFSTQDLLLAIDPASDLTAPATRGGQTVEPPAVAR